MSNLYAHIVSDSRKTHPSSRGFKEISTHIRTWDLGIEVEATKMNNGKYRFVIYKTHGSNNPRDRIIIDEVLSE